MKTSNKLLIAFGLAVILIPLLGMMIVSRVYYKENTHPSAVDVVSNNDHFESTSQNMVGRKIEPFSSIKIEDAKNRHVNLRIIADSVYGVKIRVGDIGNEKMDGITFKVDANGVLTIDLNDEPNKSHYLTIFVYAPHIKKLDIAKADGVILTVSQDSLNVNASKIGKFEFDSAEGTKQVTISTDSVRELIVYDEVVNSLILNLKGTDFEAENSSFNNLSVTSSGKADIVLRGSEHDVKKYKINQLTINKSDIGLVKFENISVTNCSGALSDQTSVDMPVINLKQMFKK